MIVEGRYWTDQEVSSLASKYEPKSNYESKLSLPKGKNYRITINTMPCSCMVECEDGRILPTSLVKAYIVEDYQNKAVITVEIKREPWGLRYE